MWSGTKRKGHTVMRLNSLGYIVRETLHSLRRNPWMTAASLLTVMISMMILGFSAFFLANASNMAATFESELEIAVFIDVDTSPDQTRDLQTKVEKLTGVASVTLVTKEEALAEFGETMGGGDSQSDDLLSDLGGTNPFPDKLTVKATDPQLVASLAEQIEVLPHVETVRYGQDFVDKLLEFTKWLRWVGLGVIGAFATAAVLLISINIKMNVFSRRREIEIMRLVGAGKGFIRWPFLLQGLIVGLLGGAAAAALVGFAYQWLADYLTTTLTFLPVVQSPELYWQVLGGILAAGTIIGTIGSALSVHKFLWK